MGCIVIWGKDPLFFPLFCSSLYFSGLFPLSPPLQFLHVRRKQTPSDPHPRGSLRSEPFPVTAWTLCHTRLCFSRTTEGLRMAGGAVLSTVGVKRELFSRSSAASWFQGASWPDKGQRRRRLKSCVWRRRVKARRGRFSCVIATWLSKRRFLKGSDK